MLARGTLPADVLFVGEAPGESEDIVGKPFCGPAGKLLNRMIERALSVHSFTYAITNLVACIPKMQIQSTLETTSIIKVDPVGRGEEPEILKCRPRLIEFFELARPKVVITLGRLAKDYLPDFPGVKVVNVIHPAAILRMNVAQKGLEVQRATVQIKEAVEGL